ncbi:GntR family transcriptional regulator [Nocardioides sp. ChNu-99]|uniref:GntR family transcriptional regulator n=1 Tax=Nocardioides sp. ChNu-99 TaxID=2839897 RepID=UPI0024049898|nr:GntR family transcriptional regulator [Nocardioides sp. ChNu-99]MDF9717817.1 GntR family transcriptional regulator [Nocardioides sp. ChNu-99]
MQESEGGPVAEEVRRRIVRMIATGALVTGDRLGTERALAERFGVSRATLRSALVPLNRAGVLERRTGRGGGTFVRGVVERDAAEQLGLPQRLAVGGGREVATVVLSVRERAADATEAAALGLGPGARVVEVERVRYADGLPLSLDRARLPAALVPGLAQADLAGSLYALLEERFGLAPDVSEEVITVAQATRREAEHLDVPPGAALLHLYRVARTADDVPFELSDDLFRADRVQIVARRGGPSRADVVPRG